jgi:hypothetical protein
MGAFGPRRRQGVLAGMNGQLQIATMWSPNVRVALWGGRGGALIRRFIVFPVIEPEYVAASGGWVVAAPPTGVSVPSRAKLPLELTVSGPEIEPEAQHSSTEAPLEVTSICAAREPQVPVGMTVVVGPDEVPHPPTARAKPRITERRQHIMVLS